MPSIWTWDKLLQSSARLNPKTRGKNYPSTPKFELLNVIPYKGTKSVLVQLQAWGVTQSALHQVSILFQKVNFIDEPPKTIYNYCKVTYDNQEYYFEKFDKFRNPISVRCSCKSFFFDFAYEDYSLAHCLYGPKPKPYKRKTPKPPQGRPYRNPRHYPGICKHIYNAWGFLKRRGYTRN